MWLSALVLVAFPLLLGFLSLYFITPKVLVVVLVGAAGLMYLLVHPRLQPEVIQDFLRHIRHEDGSYSQIAHRCGGQEAPENTMAALQTAILNGARAVEIDIDFSSDGDALVFHDDTVDRTTDGTGRVRQMTTDQLLKLDAAAKFPRHKNIERIPLLRDVIKECLDKDIVLFLDMKQSSFLSLRTIASLFKEFPKLYRYAAVCSFHPDFVYLLRWYDPRIITGLTSRRWSLSYEHTDGEYTVMSNLTGLAFYMKYVSDVLLQVSHETFLYRLCGNSLYLLEKDEITKPVIDTWKSLGVTVVAWTVNDQDEKNRFLSTWNTPIITDWLKTPAHTRSNTPNSGASDS